MIAFSQNYFGDQIPLDTFINWLNAYNLEQNDQQIMGLKLVQWQQFLNFNNQIHIILITRGPHDGTWYPPPPGIKRYFDFQLVWPNGVRSGEFHALLQNDTVVGIR